MKILAMAIGLVIIGAISGCAPGGGDPRQQASRSCSVLGPKALVGGLGGAAVGAGAGAAASRGNTAGILIGAAVGGLVGAMVGNSLDQRDCEVAQRALQQMNTAAIGQKIAWNNAATGTRGVFTPVTDASTNANGEVCREYTRDIVFKDGQQTGGDLGITCRNQNGDWEAKS